MHSMHACMLATKLTLQFSMFNPPGHAHPRGHFHLASFRYAMADIDLLGEVEVNSSTEKDEIGEAPSKPAPRVPGCAFSAEIYTQVLGTSMQEAEG